MESPRVLVPYPGPDSSRDTLDIFVYLRPETNGVQVESAILSVIKQSPYYRKDLNLVYLANLPGEYIVHHHIVEHHYRLRLHFAAIGGAAFTANMRCQFEEHYGEPFVQERVIGSFEALRRFSWEPEDLFSLWVEGPLVTRIAGQVIKRYGDLYIVNYDIPALLHKNDRGTDIAVMMFRTSAGYQHFFRLVERMKAVLVKKNILREDMSVSRAVHVSRSPVEQLMDTRDYLLLRADQRASVQDSSFARYLLSRGVELPVINGLMDFPICTTRGDQREVYLPDLCEGMDYRDAWDLVCSLGSQVRVSGSGTAVPPIPGES